MTLVNNMYTVKLVLSARAPLTMEHVSATIVN